MTLKESSWNSGFKINPIRWKRGTKFLVILGIVALITITIINRTLTQSDKDLLERLYPDIQISEVTVPDGVSDPAPRPQPPQQKGDGGGSNNKPSRDCLTWRGTHSVGTFTRVLTGLQKTEQIVIRAVKTGTVTRVILSEGVVAIATQVAGTGPIHTAIVTPDSVNGFMNAYSTRLSATGKSLRNIKAAPAFESYMTDLRTNGETTLHNNWNTAKTEIDWQPCA